MMIITDLYSTSEREKLVRGRSNLMKENQHRTNGLQALREIEVNEDQETRVTGCYVTYSRK